MNKNLNELWNEYLIRKALEDENILTKLRGEFK
jgi:hypothetical protein